MPRKKTVTPADLTAVDALETTSPPAVEPEVEPRPRTGDEWLADRLTTFAAKAVEELEQEKARFADHYAANPIDALECRGRYLIAAQATAELASQIKDRFDYAESYEGTPLANVAWTMNDYRDRLLRGYYRGTSTYQMHNVVISGTGVAIGRLILDYDCWVQRAGYIDAELASKTDRAAELKTELAPGVTIADYEALRRQSRTFELQAANINDVVDTFKAAGLKYVGQRKADLIRILVAKEFNGR